MPSGRCDPSALGMYARRTGGAWIARGAGYRVDALRDGICEMRSHRGRRELLQVFDSMKTYLIEDHRRIFDAIVGRDPEHAERVLREHFAIGDDFRRRAAIGESEARSAS